METRIYGSVLRKARLEGDGFVFLDDPVEMLADLRKRKIRIDLFTFLQMVSEPSPKYQYPYEWENVAALSVSSFDRWWTKQIDNKTRNMIRKAERKGVTVREMPFDETLVKGIWEIYNECPVRNGKPFRHYGKDVGKVRAEAGTFLDCSIFIGAWHCNTPIGFAKLTIEKTQTQAALMEIVSMIKHRDKAPTNALIAQAVRSCAQREIRFLVYSGFSRWKENGLNVFKESNGFKPINVPRYYVPLTRAGRAALSLGLHHRFDYFFPETLAAKLRELRNAWYNHKLQSTL